MTAVVVSVKEYGAVGDGVTDDTEAICAAISAAARIRSAVAISTATAAPAVVHLIPHSVHLISGRIDGASFVNLEGNGAILNWASPSRERLLFFNHVSNVEVTDLIIEAGATPPQCAIFAVNSDRLRLSSICMAATTTKEVGVRLSGCTNSDIAGCYVQGFANAYNITGASSNCSIRNSEASGTRAGVLISALGSASPSDIDVIGFAIADFPSGAGYALRSVGTPSLPARRIRFIECTVIGPGHSWSDPITPGTADQINAVYTTTCCVIGCTSLYGGDMGMSFSFCTDVTIAGNLSAFNNTGGIVTAHSSFVTISENACIDNGQNFVVARRNPAVLSGIAANSSRSISILGNILGNRQPGGPQKYGVAIAGSGYVGENITVGPNSYARNLLAKCFVRSHTPSVTNLDDLPSAQAAGNHIPDLPPIDPGAKSASGSSNWTLLSGAPSIRLPNDRMRYRIEVRANAALRSVSPALLLAISADGGVKMWDVASLQDATIDSMKRASLTIRTMTGSGQTITLWVSGSESENAKLVTTYGGGQCEMLVTRVG